jgi:hypothetical protein
VFLRSGALSTALLAAAWTTLMLWPVLRAPSSTIPIDAGDPILNASILHWNATQVPLTAAWWNFPSYVPAQGVTTFTEHLLGLWPFASPVIWITSDPVLAYNVVFYLSFVLSAITMYALVQELTGSAAGAFVAAIAFTFNAYRLGQFPHIQMLMTWGMPLALLGLHRYVATGRTAGLVLFGIGWLVTALSNGYFLVFFAVYAGCWIAWFCTARGTWRRLPGIAAAGLAASLPLVPILLQYVEVHARYGFTRSPEEIRSFAADVSGIVLAHPSAAFVSRLLPRGGGEGALFPGIAIIVLGATGLARGVAACAQPERTRWIARAALAGAVLFAIATAVAATTDLRIDGPVRLSISNPHKPLTGLLACLLVWAAASSRVRGAFSARNVALFYGVMVLLMWLLSLGPDPQLWGKSALYPPPYAWLMTLPGVDGLRVPARFWMLGVMSLSVLAGIAVSRVRRRRAVVVVIVSAVLLVEGWINVVAAEVPERFGPRPPAPDAVVLELPTGHVPYDVAAQFRGVMGGYRTINGYSGYVPQHVFPLQIGLQLRDETVLTEFRRLIPFFVSVLSDDSDGYRSLVTRSQPDARFAGEAVGRSLYFLSTLPRASDDGRGQPLAFTVTDASCWSHLMAQVADGRLDTRWECGPAKPGQQIAVDLGAATSVSEVALALGRFTSDAPRRLLIETSEDGATWTPASSGMTAGHVVRAMLEDPLRTEMRIRFQPVRARYLRLTQTGDPMEWSWSIAELTIYSGRI